MAHSSDFKFSSPSNTLKTVLQRQTNKFPIVVKTCGCLGKSVKECQDKKCLPPGFVLLLEKKVSVQYAHIRILKFQNDSKVAEEKGEDFVREHTNFVGQEFLVPVKFDCKLKLVHRSGTRLRYAQISSVIEDLPRYVRVDEDVMSVPPQHMGHNQLVPAKTQLDVKKIVTDNKNVKYLQCVAGNNTYMFNENCRINFTALTDPTLHTLQGLVGCILLPKVVQFQDFSPIDVVEDVDEMAADVHTMTSGPIEVLQLLEQRDLLVGWTRLETGDKMTTVLIPNELWEKETVQTMSFKSESEKSSFIKKKFRKCNDSTFIENKLYAVKVGSPVVTWLRSPNMIQMNLQQEEDSDSDPPERPNKPAAKKAPPVPHSDSDPPERPNKPAAKKAPPVPPPGIDSDSSEKTSKSPLKKAPPVPPSDPDSDSSSGYESPVDTKPPVPPRPGHQTETNEIPPPIHPKFGSPQVARPHTPINETPTDVQLPTKVAERADFLQKILEKGRLGFHNVHRELKSIFNKKQEQSPNCKRESIIFEHTEFKNSARVSRSQSENDADNIEYKNASANKFAQHPNKQPSVYVDRPLPPLPQYALAKQALIEDVENPTDDPADDSHEYDYPNLEGLFKKPTKTPLKRKPTYMTLSIKEVDRIARADQTSVDFYKYDVSEVARCFHMCAMEKLANLCMEQKIDGSFLEQFELGNLKKEPFCLSDFEVTKIKLVINDGWRPKEQDIDYLT